MRLGDSNRTVLEKPCSTSTDVTGIITAGSYWCKIKCSPECQILGLGVAITHQHVPNDMSKQLNTFTSVHFLQKEKLLNSYQNYF